MGFCDSVKTPRRPRKRIKRFPTRARLGRVRSKGDVDWKANIDVLHLFGRSVDCGPDTEVKQFPCGSEFEIITDTTGLIQNWWNPVDHEYMKSDVKLTSFHMVQGGAHGQVDFPGRKDFFPWDAVRDNCPAPGSDLLDDLAAKAQNHFASTVDNNGESVVNFLIELYQLAQGNIKILKRYKGIYESIRPRFEEAYARFRKSGHSEAASYHLAWEFAVKPAVKDLKRIACSFHRAMKRFEWLKLRNHKPTRVQFRIKDCFKPTAVEIFPPSSGPYTIAVPGVVPLVTHHGYAPEDPCDPPAIQLAMDTHGMIELELEDYVLDFNATGWVIFHIPDWILSDRTVGISMVYAKQEGLTNPVKIVWNALPYTWLIDWFVSYRTHLQEKLADLSPIPDADIIKVGHSFKLKTKWKVYLSYSDENGSYRLPIGRVEYRAYCRKLGYPEHQENPFRVPFAGYNLGIVASLVSQRYLRRR